MRISLLFKLPKSFANLTISQQPIIMFDIMFTFVLNLLRFIITSKTF